MPVSVGSLAAANSATSSCSILGSQCLPILEGCSSRAGGTIYSVTPGDKTQDGDGDGAVPGTALATPALPM